MSPAPGDAEAVEALARRASAGDTAALDELLVAIRGRVMVICGRMLPCREDAEEACQDALVRVARRISRFEGRSRFSTWLYTVASNTARDTYASLKRRSRERPVDDLPTAADPRRTSVIAGSRLDLLDALETLGESQPDLVEPFVLRDVNELDYNEIATVLDVPLGTVKSRIHRARQEMRQLLTAGG